MALTDASGASLVLVPYCRLVMLSKVRRKHDHESKKFEFEELTALVVGSAFCAWQASAHFQAGTTLLFHHNTSHFYISTFVSSSVPTSAVCYAVYGLLQALI